MRPAFLDSKDFWAGVMFAATGGAAVFMARAYPFGTTLRMGPGYFPIVLGALLVLFGLWFMAKGLRSHERIEGGWSLRALIVLPLSLALFGVLVERAGFVPALAVLIFSSAAAGNEFRLGEVAIATAVLTALCVAVFIWGLGLPYPLLAGF
jgi:putative tricarboxylic transport membrane protein